MDPKLQQDLDDILGSDSLDDILGESRKPRRRRAAGKHEKMKRPAKPVEGGIWQLRDKAEKAGTLGKKCLIDGVALKKSRNGQRVICGKYECFRAYRNAYRLEYDR